MSDPLISPAALAAGVASRLLHDLSGPASGITAGLELHSDADNEDLRREGLNLASASGQALLDLLEFCRAAYGGGGSPISDGDLERLAQTQFAGRRARLDWGPVPPVLSAKASQALLLLVQIAAAGLPTGGVVRVAVEREQNSLLLKIDGEGARPKLQPEAVDGLAGRPLDAGLTGRWAPARLASFLAAEPVSVLSSDAGFGLSLRIAAEPAA